MNAMSVFFAIKNAIASIGNYTVIAPNLNAPATPEKILMSIKQLKSQYMKNQFMSRAIELSIDSVQKRWWTFW